MLKGKRVIRKFSSEKICQGNCVFCNRNLGTSDQVFPVTEQRIVLACNTVIFDLPQIKTCSSACKKNVAHRRKEEDRKHIHENVDAKIKSWATGLCQSDVLVNDRVIVTHDYSPGRRIETGAAVVKRITYCPKFGYAFFSVKYAVGNRMIAVGPNGFTLPLAQSPCKRHCSKTPEGSQTSTRAQIVTRNETSLGIKVHDDDSPEYMHVGDESKDTLRRLSELQASYEGQSVLRIDAINQRRKSEDKLRHSEKELHALGRANFKTTQAAEKAKFSLVRSHSALKKSNQELQDTQDEFKKAKRDFQATVLSEKRVSEDKVLLLERSNVKANKAAEEAKYNSVITHHALNNTLQQLEHMQVELNDAKKDVYGKNLISTSLRQADSKLKLEEAKVQLQEKQIHSLQAKTVTSVVSKLVSGAKSQSLLKIGSPDALIESPTSMNPDSRRHGDWKRIFTACLDGLLDFFTNRNPLREIPLLICLDEWRAKKLKTQRTLMSRLEEGERLEQKLIEQWHFCKRTHDYQGARQALSMLVNPKRGHGLTMTECQEKLVSTVDVEVGSPVLVLPHGVMKGNNWQCGVVEKLHPDHSVDVRPMDENEYSVRSRKNLTSSQHKIPSLRVMHEKTIRASDDEIKQASKHAQSLGAGAAVEPIMRVGWTRTDEGANRTVAECLRSSSFVSRVDGGGSTARTGTKWRIKLGTSMFLKKINEVLKQKQQRLMSRPRLLALISTKEYSRLTAENCCCASCRDLGYISYRALREVVELALPSTPLQKKLLQRIDGEELFRSTEFSAHLSEESPIPGHCLCLLLTPFNDKRFKQECSHPRSDGAEPPTPVSMETQAFPSKAHSDAWSSECMYCHANKKQNLQCCVFCPSVAHKACIAKSGAEFSAESKPEWTCENCVCKHDSIHHDSRCLRCEEHAYLIQDIRSAVMYEKDLALSRGLPTEMYDWCIAMLDVTDQDLCNYHHHLIRNTNQKMVQPYCWEAIDESQYTDLFDYWARQKEKRFKTATCEGQANKGVSVHGHMWHFRNPSKTIREKFPEIDWSLYPEPAEDGGPLFCREFFRTFSNSSTQSGEDTARTKYEEEKNFRKQHPWLVENIGSMSDGAINYLSTSPLVFDVVNPYVQAKCTSEAGEGKDACDADNGRAQSTLQREKNSEQGDLCDAARHAETLDRDRAPGTVNSQMEKTGSGKSMTDKNKADTNAIPDVRTYHCYTCKNELRAYEFFSRRLSEEARRVVGYGKGHVITKDELEKKHQLEAHRVSLHGGGMSVAWAQPSALPSGQEPGYNPVGHLSRNQKSQAKKDHAIKKLKKLEDKERVKEEHGAYISSLRPNTRYCCSDCDASFRRVKDFENHKQNNCGLFAKKKARRLTHDETTVTSLVEAHDDDVGLQAVLDEERGLDLIELKLPRGMEPGWTLDVDRDIAEGEIPVPPQFEHMAWSIPCARSELKVHSTVRVSAIHFPVDGPTDFGLGWKSAFYYAKVRSTSASLVALLEYEPVDGNLDEPQGAHHCDFRNLEVGSPVSIDHETKWPAVVKGVGSLSAAARALVYSGCKIVSVNGEETLTLSAVRTKLQEKCRLNQGMKIILRRPVPTPLNRGCARVAQSKKNPYKWDEDVMGLMDNLVKDPALARRGHAVLRELKKMYGTKLNEAGLPKVPPLRFVEKRMLLLWKKNKKKELQAEHNEAVGLFDEGEDNNGSSDDDDMDGDDGPVDYEALKQKHFHDLSGVSVTLLRNRIREFMHDPAVSARDLPAGTPSSGQARSTAVRDHLRNKLAGILAGLGSL